MKFDDLSQLRTTTKRTDEGRIFQNKNVSSHKQNVRRWRYRSGYTYLLFGEIVRAGLVRAGRAAVLHGDIQLYRKPP